MKRQFLLSCSLLAAFMAACTHQQSVADPVGVWRGTVNNPSGEHVAFALEIKHSGNQLAADLINGTENLAASGVIQSGDLLKIRFDFYDGTLEAHLAGDQLTGTFTRQWGKKILTRNLTAERTPENSPGGIQKQFIPSDPNIDPSGDWILKVGVGDAQKLWRAAFQTQAHDATGTLIPIGGDWGEMAGTWENNTLTLNRFDGINSHLVRLHAQPDGTLAGELDLGLFDPKRPVIAQRITDQNKDLVAALPDPQTYTRMKNPTEPFRFSFPDLNGKTVSWNDPRFKNKVVAISITGSWCPNCQEETPFMESLYEKYKAQGFEVVALAFEYTGDTTRDLEQVKIFAQRHGVTFPMLLAGTTDDAPQKLDQLANFSAFPTTIYIGRDGLVKNIHAGFEGRATGERFTKLKAETESSIQQLLAEK